MIDLSTYAKTLKRKKPAVFGLGISGLSVIKAFKRAGIECDAYDDNPDSHKKANTAGANIVDLTQADFSKYGCLVLSPGVPYHFPEMHDVVKRAQEADVEILGDIELFSRAGIPESLRTISITGTNGKSTTTSLVKHILQSSKKKSVLAGNIGMPILNAKIPAGDESYMVIEMSSYQLDLCPSFGADIAALINITPDHIDRHGDMEGYALSKSKIFQNNEGEAVISIDDSYCEKIYNTMKSEGRTPVAVSVEKEIESGVYIKGGQLFDVIGQERIEVGSVKNITLLNGMHNKQNIAVAYAVTRLCGLEAEDILEAVYSYPGLPHRQFPVRTINGVTYINDSKATNAEAASKALTAHKNVFWVLGGIAKEGGLDGLERFADHIKHAFVIGQAQEEFSDWLGRYGIAHNLSQTLENAVKEAHQMAQDERGQPGGSSVVLLSPACASFDQFDSFEHRGDEFSKMIEALDESSAS